MMNTVEMLDPETGKTFAAVVDDGKLVPYAKITGQQLVALVHDRDELLAALKAIVLAFDTEREIIDVAPSVAKARALIARIDGGNG